MQKLIFMVGVCLACLPQLSWGQDTDRNYLRGAVPEEAGRVVFSKTYDLPGVPQGAIFDRMLTWATARMAQNANGSKVVYSDPQDGMIVAAAEEYLVFTAKALSLDRAWMNYQLSVACRDGACLVKIERIRYTYEETQKSTAEEKIADQVALDKKGQLVRGLAKFRTKTVDFADATFESVREALGIAKSAPLGQAPLPPALTVAPGPAVAAPVVETPPAVAPAAMTEAARAPKSALSGRAETPPAPVEPVAPAVAADPPEGVAPDPLAGYTRVSLQAFPGPAAQDQLRLVSRKDPRAEGLPAQWGAMGTFAGREAVYCLLDPAAAASAGDTYLLKCYARQAYPDSSGAYLILECRRLSSGMLDAPAGGARQQIWIGELLGVWRK